MLNRFQKTTCPKCGHYARPEVREPGSQQTESLLFPIHGVGIAYSAFRHSGAELFCASCGEQLTTSIQQKAKAAIAQGAEIGAERLRAVAASLITTCPSCHASVKPARFCSECGTALKE